MDEWEAFHIRDVWETFWTEAVAHVGIAHEAVHIVALVAIAIVPVSTVSIASIVLHTVPIVSIVLRAIIPVVPAVATPPHPKRIHIRDVIVAVGWRLPRGRIRVEGGLAGGGDEGGRQSRKRGCSLSVERWGHLACQRGRGDSCRRGARAGGW
jgi:hypothetical protein